MNSSLFCMVLRIWICSIFDCNPWITRVLFIIRCEQQLLLQGVIFESGYMDYIFQVLDFTKKVKYSYFLVTAVRSFSLLRAYAQSRSSRTVPPDFFAPFLAFKHSGGTFPRLKSFVTYSRRKLFQVVSNLLSSQDWQLYKRRLSSYASSSFIRVDVFILLISLILL